MALPVVTAASGGLPVVEVAAGTPVTEALSGRGMRVTKVASRGMPVTFIAAGNEWPGGGDVLPFTGIGFGVWGGSGPAFVSSFATGVTRPMDTQVVFFDPGSWALFTGSIPALTALWTGTNCCWSVPLVPFGGTFAEVTAGTRDSVFTQCATAMLAAAPAGKKIITRIGWEFNGDWFGWGAAGNEANYVAAFNRVVGLFKAVSQRFAFDLCINYADFPGVNVDTIVAGVKANLTFLGNDVYWMAGDNTGNGGGDAFGYVRTKTWGIEATKAYGVANGLLYSMPEIGSPDVVPTFGAQMLEWIYQNNPAYFNWWEGNDGTTDHRITAGTNPLTLQNYKLRFGKPQITTSATTSSAQNVDAVIALTTAYAQTTTWSVVSGTASIAGSTLTIPGAAAGTTNVTVRATNQWGLTSDLAIVHTFTAPHTFVNTEASTFVARITVPPSEAQKSYLDAFWTAIKAGPLSASNLLPKVDTFGFGFIDSQAATLNAKSAAYGTVVLVNAPSYVAGQGYQGAFTGTKCLNMGLAFNRGGNVFAQNSATLAAWQFNNLATATPILGNSNHGSALKPKQASNASGRANGFGTGPTVAMTDARGFIAVSRSSASAEALYKNGLSIATTSSGDASSGNTGDSLLGLTDSTSFPDSHIMGAWWMGSNLTVNEHKDLYNAYRNLMVSWGVITAGSFPVAT